ncbi:FAD/NAD(P)-binding domain-containing protein [Aspergillus affinis]|uniref:FAD/NAD(P)-binding domain-containing protein n=1 Tax=Aspergillus affinis TaxID=1070780 RepID=UPI0022FDFA2E|nr:FAD/NAD(P)-binding domain-containing protein [Aspergillus affinis]KAI9038314.1 FAD/NAD(P)-binding domain-containing protein [Aspergillus affinis]
MKGFSADVDISPGPKNHLPLSITRPSCLLPLLDHDPNSVICPRHLLLPVCIVGAGPAGLSAAAELEGQGHRTVIFEKQSAVGGKCQAVYQNGSFSPLGAFIFMPPTYRESIRLLLDTDMTSASQLLMTEVDRYIDWWNNLIWMHAHPSSALVLQYLTPGILLILLKVQRGVKIEITDFHQTLEKFAAKRISGAIHLNTAISKIDRTGEHPIVAFHSDGHDSRTQTCSAVILAFPPAVSALKSANLDLSEGEHEVFGPVGINSFYSGAVKMSTPHGMTFGAASPHPGLPPDATGDPVVCKKLHGHLDIAITSSWGPYRGTLQGRGICALKDDALAIQSRPSRPVVPSRAHHG